ncbi:hypothetical protein [Paenibacillus popilliae]|uniref:Pyruvate-formate lyase-activating enzyme n=1 Tax=Paenibacillus popilliae ATCC 14706 TaxID=1212764 RepID=M9LRH7_PAEPP|nr:hypothetical protein [Paenibacillus popilliae]GAC44006.1 pyruvate-formate lyase-activating enzyme [Paenibacillus popilliae ATCC 14706]
MMVGLEQAKIIELLYFIDPYPKRDIAEFQGKYHHLGFNWRAFPLKGDLEPLTNRLHAALQGVDKEERYDFYAQIMWHILDQDESAMERLFEAAFGGDCHDT